MLDIVLRLWKALPLGTGFRAALAPTINAVLTRLLRRPPPVCRPLDQIAPGPLVLSGFMGEVLGLGTAARSTLSDLRAAGLSVVTHELGPLRQAPLHTPIPLPGAGRGGVWICHCNPPEFERLRFGLDRADLEGRYRIGIWAWELERLPQAWVKSAAMFHEIWAPTTFVAEAIRASLGEQGAGGPAPLVRVMPITVGPAPAVESIRPDLGIAQDAFVVLTMFDLRSTRARKNPDGALEAYVRAFPEPSDRHVLICKVLSPQAAPAEFEALRQRAATRPDIVLLTETLSDRAVGNLIGSVDVLLSLHRSEGYGLTLAEAMQRERAVVATAWSGNMDFMDADCAMLVPYRLAEVHDPQMQYSGHGAHWAEPDLEAAAQALRDLAASPELRVRLGNAARRRITEHETCFPKKIAASVWLAKLEPTSQV